MVSGGLKTHTDTHFRDSGRAGSSDDKSVTIHHDVISQASERHALNAAAVMAKLSSEISERVASPSSEIFGVY